MVNRGNKRGTVFFDDGDHALFLTLREGDRRAGSGSARARWCSRASAWQPASAAACPIVNSQCMTPI